MISRKLILTAFCLVASFWVHREAAADPPAPVAPSSSSPFGQSYSEWSARWWQWAFSLPVDGHPLFDTADCSEGQSDGVWFLGGTFNAIGDGTLVVGEADRDCIVPPGTALFFPIINAECDNLLIPDATEAELRDCANDLGDHVVSVEAFVDGAEVDHLGLFRFDSALFPFGPLPDNNLFGSPEGTTGVAVGDGYYLMLRPLSRGTHLIHFEARIVFTLAEDGFDFEFIQDIDYLVNVER